MSTHGPIETQYIESMRKLARAISAMVPKGTGFAILMFPLNATDGRMNYLSNARREDMIVALKEFIARNEGFDPETSKVKQ